CAEAAADRRHSAPDVRSWPDPSSWHRDVASVVAAVELDVADCLVGARASVALIAADPGDREHPAPARDQHAVAVDAGAGVQNLDAFDGGGLVEAADLVAETSRLRISVRGDHHGDGRAVVPDGSRVL